MEPKVVTDCPLCHELDGVLIFEHPLLRVIRATNSVEANYPVFYRVVWRAHVRELSELTAQELLLCMCAVVQVERVLLAQLSPRPEKINLATLGNVVPHLHWHVIARYVWDAHWPKPVWSTAERSADAATLATLTAQLAKLDAAINQALSEMCKEHSAKRI